MNKPVKPVNQEMIADWAESPVTLKLLGNCEEELRDVRDTTVIDCFFPGEPQKTQETLVRLDERESFWASWVALLSGDWSYFEEEEKEEAWTYDS